MMKTTFNKRNKTLMAGLAATALSGALAAPAQADLFAYANIFLEGFTVLGSDGQILDADEGGDFNFLSFTSSGDYQGSLDGTAGFSAGVPSTLGDIDFPAACLSTTGDCNPLLPENSFPFFSGPQGADFIAADQMQVGSPILGVELTNPATIGSLAVGSLSNTQASGSANVNNGLEASWQFSLAQDQGITFEGNVRSYLEAFASAGELAPGKASAATQFEITITNLQTGAVVFDSGNFAGVDLLSQTTSINANGFPVDVTTCGDFAATFGTCGTELNTAFSLTSGALDANTLYQLSARQNVNIDIARVPAPGVLALMGAGLLSLFAFGRRRA